MPNVPTPYCVHRCFNRLIMHPPLLAPPVCLILIVTTNREEASKKNIWSICNKNTCMSKELCLLQ